MITSKIMYETEDGQLFGSHEDAIIHDQKLRKQKENQIKQKNKCGKKDKNNNCFTNCFLKKDYLF